MPNKSSQNLPEDKIDSICSIDSLKFSRKGKPDWVDRGDYPLETLILSFVDNQYELWRTDSLVISGHLSDNDKSIAMDRLNKVELDDLNKIYNTDAHWNVELDLLLFCNKDSKTYIVKSYGQHGENPKSISDSYSYLLRFMVREFRKIR